MKNRIAVRPAICFLFRKTVTEKNGLKFLRGWVDLYTPLKEPQTTIYFLSRRIGDLRFHKYHILFRTLTRSARRMQKIRKFENAQRGA